MQALMLKVLLRTLFSFKLVKNMTSADDTHLNLHKFSVPQLFKSWVALSTG